MAEIKIIENPSEIGAGTRGASLGIGALKVAAQNKASGFFGKYERFVVEDENDLLNEEVWYLKAKHIDGIVKIYQRTADIVSHVFENGDFPLVLAGDHSSAGGTIAGIKKHFPNKRLGVIWIDAHADLHTPYTTPSGNIHGMPLATAIGTDNLESKQNDPKKETIAFWNELKQIGGISPKIHPADLVFIGVRDTETPENELIERQNIKNYPVDELRSKGVEEVTEEIKNKLQECDLVYVSFDVDSMDCDLVSRGTGTPVENGLTPEEANDLMENFASWRKVACIEMVEVNPCLDDKINKMAETAYGILENFTNKIEKRLE
ncbi:MAG: arginase [Crocinitomicaceae bacterium]|nr:arginase [Crocinitomicaceae bacterium]